MKYSHRPPSPEVLGSAPDPARSTSPGAAAPPGSTAQTSPGRPAAGKRSGHEPPKRALSSPAIAVAPSGGKQQALELVVTWKGGRSVDLVRLVIDGAFRRPRDVRLDSGRERLLVGLDVDARAAHSVELSVSFVGESRTDLTLEVSVDGVRTGSTVRAAQATQKWDARWSSS